MKIQDLVFLIMLAILVISRKPILFVYLALFLLALSAPLFAFHIFFTAQRLVMYSFFLLLFYVLFAIIKLKNEK